MLSDVVADQIKRHRERRRLRRVDLAAVCADLGWPELTEAALGNLETGRRSADGRRRRFVTVDELLVLAAALEVPPVALLLPLGQASLVEVLPDIEVSPDDALLWITGEERLQDGDPIPPESPGSGTIRRVWEHASLARRLLGTMDAIDRGGPDVNPVIRQQAATHHRTLWALRRDMREHREIPPALSDELRWVDTLTPELTRDWQPDQLPEGFRPSDVPPWRLTEGDAHA